MNVRLLRHALPTLALGAALFGFAPTASAQDPMDLHFSGFFALGAGGDLDIDGDSVDDLDPTVGFGLRLDVPVLEYLTVGGQVGFNFWKTDAADEREMWIDLPDLILRLRYPVRLGNGLLEPYLGFLIGGTISTIGDADNKDTSYGWNTGILFGMQYFFTDALGLLFEVGWHHHAASHEATIPFIGTVEADYVTDQAALNFGFTVLF